MTNYFNFQMGYITVALQASMLLQSATYVYAQFMPQMSFAHLPQMAQMPGMSLPQAVQTMQGPPMPMGMHMPGGMAMAMPNMGMQPKMPVVVMPYHSKNQDKKNKNKKRKKKRHPKKYTYKSESCSSDDSVSSDDTDSSNERPSNWKRFIRAGHKSRPQEYREKHKRRREVLTPVISYVTKDGYVVYQKKVKKDKAKDWLDIGQKPPKSRWSDNDESSVEKMYVGGSEEKLKDEVKRKYRKIMNKRN